MRVFIVEDELLVADYLQEIICKHGHEVIGSADDLVSAKEGVFKVIPDVVFLDIRLANDDNGIKLGEILSGKGIPFIYITANNDLVTLKKAASTQPFSYLSKPFQERDIVAVMEMLRNQFILREADSTITLKTPSGNVRIAAKEILYIIADNVYVEIHTKIKVYVERATLKTIEDKLTKNIFIRIHRSYLINKTYIKGWTNSSVTIQETILPVSEKYKKAFLDSVS